MLHELWKLWKLLPVRRFLNADTLRIQSHFQTLKIFSIKYSDELLDGCGPLFESGVGSNELSLSIDEIVSLTWKALQSWLLLAPPRPNLHDPYPSFL